MVVVVVKEAQMRGASEVTANGGRCLTWAGTFSGLFLGWQAHGGEQREAAELWLARMYGTAGF